MCTKSLAAPPDFALITFIRTSSSMSTAPRRKSGLLALHLAWLLTAFFCAARIAAQNAPADVQNLPRLTDIKKILTLTPDEIHNGPPVQLTGVITGVDRVSNTIFLQEAGTGIAIISRNP